MYRIEITGRMPTLNTLYRGHRYAHQKTKNEWCKTIGWELVAHKLPKPLRTPFSLSVTCYTKRKRDVDNCIIAAKFFLDALVENGYIPDDNPDYVPSVSLSWKKATGVEKVIYIIQ